MKRLFVQLFELTTWLIFIQCGSDSPPSEENSTSAATTTFTISGKLTYDDYTILASKIDYNQKAVVPIRRVTVQALGERYTMALQCI